jgi:hypothetical protein
VGETVTKADDCPRVFLIKMAEGQYADGFHVHLNENFDANMNENLIIFVNNNSWVDSKDTD